MSHRVSRAGARFGVEVFGKLGVLAPEMEDNSMVDGLNGGAHRKLPGRVEDLHTTRPWSRDNPPTGVNMQLPAVGVRCRAAPRAAQQFRPERAHHGLGVAFPDA